MTRRQKSEVSFDDPLRAETCEYGRWEPVGELVSAGASEEGPGNSYWRRLRQENLRFDNGPDLCEVWSEYVSFDSDAIGFCINDVNGREEAADDMRKRVDIEFWSIGFSGWE